MASSSNDFEVMTQMQRFGTSKAVIHKAHKYLTDGQVMVVDLHGGTAEVWITGTDRYEAKYSNGIWLCSCPSRSPVCAHTVAASLVTGKMITHTEEVHKQRPFDPSAFIVRIA